MHCSEVTASRSRSSLRLSILLRLNFLRASLNLCQISPKLVLFPSIAKSSHWVDMLPTHQAPITFVQWPVTVGLTGMVSESQLSTPVSMQLTAHLLIK